MTFYDQTKMTELEHTTTVQKSISGENKRKRWWSQFVMVCRKLPLK